MSCLIYIDFTKRNVVCFYTYYSMIDPSENLMSLSDTCKINYRNINRTGLT